MSESGNLDEYEHKLLNCSPKNSVSTFQKVADDYEDDILSFCSYPDNYIDFFLKLMSDSRFYTKQGLWQFLLMIGVDVEIMPTEQTKAIAKVLTENFIHYEDEMLCLTTCDFIARYYPFDEAEKILLMLKEIEKGKKEQGFANDGLRILNNERIRAEKEE